MEEKESFVFYRSFYNSIHKVKDKTKRCDLYEAIFELALNNNEIEFDDGLGDIILELVKPQICANKKRYEVGKKGGAPVGNKNASKNKNNLEAIENNLENNSKQPTKQPETTSKQLENNLKQPQNNLNNHRLNQKQPNVNVNDNDNVNDNVNVDVKENKKEKTTTSTTKIKNLALIHFYEEHFGRTVSSVEVEILETWKDTELTRYAIKQAELARAFNIKYVQTILKSYQDRGIDTVAKAEEAERKFQESKTTVKNSNGFKDRFEQMEEEKRKFLEAHKDDS